MKKDKAIEYLKSKGKKVTEEEINKVMSEGKIYGDPLVEIKD
jgi:translation elongation factor EF-Ts